MNDLYRKKRKRDMSRNMIRHDDSEEIVSRLKRMQARKNKVRFWLVFGGIVLAILVAVGAFLAFRFYRYTGYEMKWEKELPEGSFSGYEHFGENVVRYSHDGASYMNKDGDDVWVDTYEMANPKVYVSGEYICIYDSLGTQIRIYNQAGLIGSANTLKPVTKAVIAENGVCAAILEDNDAAYITFFKKDGSSLDIIIKSRLEGDGYPVDIALSPEGTQLISAFAYLDGGVMRSKIVFYDFSEIGKSIPNRLVGGFEEDFTESVVARVRFVNSTYSYAVADTGIYIFSSKNISSPELVQKIETGEHIESIMHSGKHFGVIYSDLSSGKAVKENTAEEETKTADSKDEKEKKPEEETEELKNYRLVIYNADGSILFKREFDEQYDTFIADDSFVYLINDDICTIINMHGIVKFSDFMEDQARMITHGNMPGNFIFSGSTYMRDYQFK